MSLPPAVGPSSCLSPVKQRTFSGGDEADEVGEARRGSRARATLLFGGCHGGLGAPQPTTLQNSQTVRLKRVRFTARLVKLRKPQTRLPRLVLRKPCRKAAPCLERGKRS